MGAVPQPETMITENILVNDFMFCLDHGDEYCGICSCDHRECNTIRIEDELPKDLAERAVPFLIEHRRPLNAYDLGAVIAVPNAEHLKKLFQCEHHKSTECKTCFNWVKIIKKEIADARKQGFQDMQWRYY